VRTLQWETKEGQKRSKLAVVADDVSLSLRFDGASVPDGIAASPKETAAVKTVQAAFATDEEPF
jgi:single-stranded DNA-binding protein